METIDELADAYVRENARQEGYDCEDVRAAYLDGAVDVRQELTKWNDPKELPERSKDVLLKLRYEEGAEPSYTVGYWNGIYYGDVLGGDAEVIGWREIPE